MASGRRAPARCFVRARGEGVSQMAVMVFIPAALRGEADGHHSLEMAIAPGATLGNVLDALSVQYPRLGRRIRDERGEPRRYVNIFVGENECRSLSGVDTLVTDGTEVRVIPSVAGGSLP